MDYRYNLPLVDTYTTYVIHQYKAHTYATILNTGGTKLFKYNKSVTNFKSEKLKCQHFSLRTKSGSETRWGWKNIQQ